MIATAAVLLAGAPAARVRPAARIAIAAVAALIGCAVSIAVVALGEHRVIDTVGGAAVGISVVLTATFLLDLPVSRRVLELAPLGRRRQEPDAA
jgi:hypothetical protein